MCGSKPLCIVHSALRLRSRVNPTSATREGYTPSVQAMAFLAGANSIFSGDKLLTTPNPEEADDASLFDTLGLKGRPAFVPYAAGEASSNAGNQAASNAT
jgi:biotin synthase